MTTGTSPARNRAGTTAGPAPGQATDDPRRFNVRAWLLWTVAFVSFPVAGIAAQACARAGRSREDRGLPLSDLPQHHACAGRLEVSGQVLGGFPEGLMDPGFSGMGSYDGSGSTPEA